MEESPPLATKEVLLLSGYNQVGVLDEYILHSKQSTPTPGANSGNGAAPSTPTTPAPPSTPAVEVKVEEEKPSPDFLDSITKNEEKSKIGFPSSQMNNLNVGDYRTLVKTLVCGVKTITWGCASCKVSI